MAKSRNIDYIQSCGIGTTAISGDTRIRLQHNAG